MPELRDAAPQVTGNMVPRETIAFSADAISSAVISSPSRYFSISSSADSATFSISSSWRRCASSMYSAGMSMPSPSRCPSGSG